MAEDEFRYLYERLNSGEFQQLVSAPLAHKYPEFRAFLIEQADGGRDGADRGRPVRLRDGPAHEGLTAVSWVGPALP